MKTAKQIENWLKAQPYYDELKDNLIECRCVGGEDAMRLLGGELGDETMKIAVLMLPPKKYDWDKLEQQFREWFESM